MAALRTLSPATAAGAVLRGVRGVSDYVGLTQPGEEEPGEARSPGAVQRQDTDPVVRTLFPAGLTEAEAARREEGLRRLQDGLRELRTSMAVSKAVTIRQLQQLEERCGEGHDRPSGAQNGKAGTSGPPARSAKRSAPSPPAVLHVRVVGRRGPPLWAQPYFMRFAPAGSEVWESRDGRYVIRSGADGRWVLRDSCGGQWHAASAESGEAAHPYPHAVRRWVANGSVGVVSVLLGPGDCHPHESFVRALADSVASQRSSDSVPKEDLHACLRHELWRLTGSAVGQGKGAP
eukprot:TRINITY_DN7973_c0_g1_i1.p1 TRINITY_DN7973_c0_g1~~TRINITY_DN7973_c0_g1_i1.p1  ORF type:complete len:317 (+),score=66.88 TRINITY_DN7973_c0_g1_i1:82-951(+)